MKILYLYIDNHKSFENNEYNFTSNDRFHYDKDRGCIVREEVLLKFPEDIYNTITEGKSISSVSAIISGDNNKKCDFKRLLDEIISDKCNACNFIIIFEYDSHIYYDTNLPYKIHFTGILYEKKKLAKISSFLFYSALETELNKSRIIPDPLYDASDSPDEVFKDSKMEVDANDIKKDNLYLYLLLLNINQSCEDSKNDHKNFVMFLDNIDANIPPKRQGECLFEIIRFINKYFEFYHVHIILTTNSPIVLSDIPYGNVIDLDGENSDGNDTECKFNTFAANIYSIYHYAYHARTNLLLGGISYRIIKILLEYFINRKIDSRANHILEHKNDIIETIGDPIIRNQLKRLFSLENYKNL